MNTFINENSDLIFQEVRGTYEETFGLIFRKITNDIFLRVPMNKIFPLKWFNNYSVFHIVSYSLPVKTILQNNQKRRRLYFDVSKIVYIRDV